MELEFEPSGIHTTHLDSDWVFPVSGTENTAVNTTTALLSQDWRARGPRIIPTEHSAQWLARGRMLALLALFLFSCLWQTSLMDHSTAVVLPCRAGLWSKNLPQDSPPGSLWLTLRFAPRPKLCQFWVTGLQWDKWAFLPPKPMVGWTAPGGGSWGRDRHGGAYGEEQRNKIDQGVGDKKDGS